MKRLPWLILILLAGLAPYTAQAQQTGARPYYVEAGGYHIGVLSRPSNLSLGTIDYLITVNDPETTQPIPDARVIIHAAQAEGAEQGLALALNTPANPDRYTARVELDKPGVWKMSVEVSGPRGRVEVEAPSQVVPKPRLSQAGGFVFIGVFLVLAAGLAYLVWTVRRVQKNREAANAN